MPLAQYMHYALGSDHAVTVIVQRLAHANLSSATKRRQQEEQKLLEVGTVKLSCPLRDSALRSMDCHTHTLAVFHSASHPQMAVSSCPLGAAVIRGVSYAASYASCSSEHCQISFILSCLLFFCCFYELILFKLLQNRQFMTYHILG